MTTPAGLTDEERADDDREPFRNRREEAAWNNGYAAGLAARTEPAQVPRGEPMPKGFAMENWPENCCWHCGQPKKSHRLGNYQDGAYIGLEFLVCPVCTYKDKDDAAQAGAAQGDKP